MITTTTTTTKKTSTLGHEREKERERESGAIVSVQIPATVWNEIALECFCMDEYSSACAAAEWDSAHVMCATSDALNVVSFLYVFPLRDMRRFRLHVCCSERGRYRASGCELGQ
jgi:hypothetical protein